MTSEETEQAPLKGAQKIRTSPRHKQHANGVRDFDVDVTMSTGESVWLSLSPGSWEIFEMPIAANRVKLCVWRERAW